VSDSAINNIHLNKKQKAEITNKSTGKITCRHAQPVWVWKMLRNFCREFQLHFHVVWLTPLFERCCLKALLWKKRFSRGVSANTARFLRFFSLETLTFLSVDGITDFGIALAKHCNLIFCSFVLQIDWSKTCSDGPRNNICCKWHDELHMLMMQRKNSIHRRKSAFPP